VQAKAQTELDAEVSATCPPNFDNHLQLPYIEAILSEVLRWNPVMPMGICLEVHYLFFIQVLPIIFWTDLQSKAILQDEEDYPNPIVFKAKQFIPGNGKEPQPHPLAVFGFGRCICPGYYLMLNSTWIAIASMVATLSISKAMDSEGGILELSDTFTGGFLRSVLLC
ncbi:cytochrome P450, partial [Armillaria fumosa]